MDQRTDTTTSIRSCFTADDPCDKRGHVKRPASRAPTKPARRTRGMLVLITLWHDQGRPAARPNSLRHASLASSRRGVPFGGIRHE